MEFPTVRRLRSFSVDTSSRGGMTAPFSVARCQANTISEHNWDGT